MEKVRASETRVSVSLSNQSPINLSEIKGKDVIIFDDMVRTGSTIMKTCWELKKGEPNKIIFFVTHFYASDEGREKLNVKILDEIVTTNTIPTILNRDMQGRLRKKMVVLKIEKWIAKNMTDTINVGDSSKFKKDFYDVDMSSMHFRFENKEQ